MAGFEPASFLQSVVLFGGKGTRLPDRRKRLGADSFPHLDPRHYGIIGPKALALVAITTESGTRRVPAAELHLDVHAACPQIRKVTLSLGFAGETVREHFLNAHRDCYQGLHLSYVIEKRPAGTLAPVVKMHLQGSLPDQPMVYANGDNLLDVDLYRAYVEGCELGLKAGIPLDLLVIDLVAFVPWVNSDRYGALEIDRHTSRVVRFREKAPVAENPFEEIDGERLTPVNSGFSIVVNPEALFARYLSSEIIDTSRGLEEGTLDYGRHERAVKYETLYGRVASAGHMIAIPCRGFWTDLGTEEKITDAEARLGTMAFVRKAGDRSL